MEKKLLLRIALAAFMLAVMSALPSRAVTLTYEQAVQLVKEQRASQNLDCDSVNFLVAETDTIINNYCCAISEKIPAKWASSFDKLLVFVNEKPRLCWNHPCSYYYLPKVVDDLNNVPIVKYEGIMPPNRVNLAPVEMNYVRATRAIGNSNLLHNPVLSQPHLVPKVGNNTQHQVIIMAAGINDADEFTLRWNECASFYRVLTQVYNIPKNNIHIFMGLEFSDNLMIDANNDTVPMLQDLDGDGLNENIQPLGYGQLDDFRDYVADSLAEIGVKHLFTFYTGSLGAYNPRRIGNYTPVITEGVDVMDLEATIYRCHAEYNSVFGCCIDAEYLTSVFNEYDNSIAIGANYYNYYLEPGYNDGNPHEYFRHWIAAIAGQNMETGVFVNADSDDDGYVTMTEANAYASSKETDNTSFMHENPLGVASLVSFGHLELYSGLRINIDGWESSDIWIRNQDDGLIKRSQDALVYNPSSPNKFIYTRVSNQSAENYEADGVYLQLYWKKPVLGIDNSTLFEAPELADMRGYITTIPLNQNIGSGQDTIITYQWKLPEILVDFAKLNGNKLPIVVMAELTRDTTKCVPHDLIATNGFFRLDVQSGPIVKLNSGNGLISNTGLYNVNRIPIYYLPSPYLIEVNSLNQSGFSRVYSRDNLTVTFSQDVVMNAVTEGSISSDDQSASEFKVKGTGRIGGLYENLTLDSMIVRIKSNALSSYTASSSDKLGLSIYSGHEIEQSNLKGISPVPYGTIPIEFYVEGTDIVGPPVIQSTGNSDNSIDLTATQVSETSSCLWYNYDGLMSTERSLHLDADAARGIVQLIAIDEENGTRGQAFANLDALVNIKDIKFCDLNNYIEVSLVKPATQKLTVQVASPITGSIVANGQIIEGESTFQISTAAWQNGVYLVSVLNNGTVVRTVQLIKK